MNEDELKARTRRFALDVIRFVRGLPRDREADVICRQLVRSATSVGANYRAVCRARSGTEFIARLAVVEEEADESIYWIELLTDSGPVPVDVAKALKSECEEILRIIVASIKTTRSRQRGREANPKSKIQNPK